MAGLREVFRGGKLWGGSEEILARLDTLLSRLRESAVENPWPDLTVSECLDILVERYRREKRSCAYNYAKEVKHPRLFLGHLHPRELSTEVFERFKEYRSQTGVKRATVNRDLANVRTALNNATRTTRFHPQSGRALPLLRRYEVPHFPFYPDASEPRCSFIDLPDFYRLHREVESRHPDIGDVVWFAFWSAWRPCEILRLTWSMVDVRDKMIRLPGPKHKNRNAKSLPIAGPIEVVLWRRWRRAQPLKPEWKDQPVFLRHGRPIKSWRRAFEKAAERAGLHGVVPYDLKRSLVRLMELSGVPRPLAMRITGHRSETMYRRYFRFDERDLKTAALKFWLSQADPANGRR